jgi:hypothetical protein
MIIRSSKLHYLVAQKMHSTLKYQLQNIIPEQHRWKLDLLSHWDGIIGHLKDKVIIEKITEGTLFLGVCHPAWAQELFLLSSVIKEKINRVLAENRISEIKFKVVAITKNKNIKTVSKITTYSLLPVTLNEKEQRAIQAIGDDELQNALKLFYSRCKHVKGEK